ncbi:hypothetical protein DVV91_17290 [Clostridium botulinum]|uniref:antA/AntB antirepressor family protein n=1 Tax=Clostridium botulinum TaxID=1491 RepID=UPI0019670166|nr:antA/AntB antirepressor family protein [Clostridium botulinum]MBN1076077.1 hypothetical protein [Clostridium botulinum]
MKKFSKKDLINKLGMSDERASIVMKAQREFPELLLNDGNEFCVNGRTMWGQLGKPQGKFADWIKRKVISKNYIHDTDYICISQNCETQTSNGRKGVSVTKEYMFTINCAKKIGMRENTDNGDLICDYFIYLEEAIRDMNKWIVIREPQKQGYKEMTNAISKQYKKTHDGKEANKFIYSTNADMLNLCAFGHKSKTMKEILDIEYNELLRDNLVSEANKCLYELQLLNQSLVLSNIDFATRKLIIQNTCNEKYIGIRIKVISEFSQELNKLLK